jgi:FkbM family methyltransferase
MTFISYAQNYEDVLLWRALRDIVDGFYIDVGAAHPDVDSVTRAFYDRGWRGVDIEPVPEYALRLRVARPRNAVVQAAVADTAAEATLFVVPGTGLSTLHRDLLGSQPEFPFYSRRVATTTLSAICRAHAPSAIHFLKVDAEGSENAVLSGADFRRFRPWIVVIEATAPNSTCPMHGDWESILLSAGYRFLWFDGLNRFYAAAEQYERVAPHFRTPPNVFDNFVRAADAEWARRLGEAELLAALRKESLDAADAKAALAAGVAEAARVRAQLREAERNALAATSAELRRINANLQQELHDARKRIEAMRASTSWRITAPMRRAVRIARGERQPRCHASADVAARAVVVTPASERRAERGRQRRTVHQVHGGSAVGDAITNAMLLTRRVLRDLGYRSEIFVENLEPSLAGELRPLGFSAFDRVVAAPAPKILLYHNITPPELLAGIPPLQRAAAIGREQLVQLRPHVTAALADSEFNAIELRSLGFDPVQACTLLFDVDELAGREPAAAEPDRPFTILFVGRVIESKAQADLVAAYASFRRQFAAPSRLVLVGRIDGAGEAYLAALHDAMQAAGARHVQLTGLVSDAELRARYAAADLYVSLSRHEGFGVPIIEAIAAGVPVLAWPGGAVPYTLGQDDLLADRTPEAVAARMLALANDPARRRATAERQRRSLERFRLDRHIPRLVEALAVAGAAPPLAPGTRQLLAANARFTIAGHVNGTYSLAAINRDLALALEAERPGTVRLIPVEGSPTHDLSGVPAGQAERLAALAARPPHPTGPHVVITQHYPLWVPAERGDLPLALFFWEESLVPEAMITVLNRHLRGVLTPSGFVAKALIDSGLTLPVRVIGHALDLADFRALAGRPRAPIAADAPFTFLHVSSCFPRKGVDCLLTAYARAFRRGDPVRLLVKGFANPHNDVAEQIAALRSRDPDLPAIEFINRDMSRGELLDLYTAADALVLPTRGEGYNLPAAEAMAAGLPLIITNHGGHLDFCTASHARLVDVRFAPSASHLATPHSVWAEPDVDDLTAALREAASMRESGGKSAALWAERASRAAQAIARAGDRPAFVRKLVDSAVDILLAPPVQPMRLACVTSWNVRCGVAEYARHLLYHFPDEQRARTVILSDDRTATGSDAGAFRVRTTWRVGDAIGWAPWSEAIASEDPDVVLIQHQPGLLGWMALASLLLAAPLRQRVVAATLHNTRNLCELPESEREFILAALTAIERVLVHTVGDLNALQSFGVRDNVALLPHGAPPALPPRPARRLGAGAAPRIGCYGFFLPGKGIPVLIEAFRAVRSEWPDGRLRLVNAAYGTAESDAEIAACRSLAERLGVAAHIEWETAFLPHERSLALLADCDLIVLPYQDSTESSSAALRSALGAGVASAVTPLPLFEEARAATLALSGIDAGAIASDLVRYLRADSLRATTERAARTWLVDRSWPAIARRLHGLLSGLHANKQRSP